MVAYVGARRVSEGLVLSSFTLQTLIGSLCQVQGDSKLN